MSGTFFGRDACVRGYADSQTEVESVAFTDTDSNEIDLILQKPVYFIDLNNDGTREVTVETAAGVYLLDFIDSQIAAANISAAFEACLQALLPTERILHML